MASAAAPAASTPFIHGLGFRTSGRFCNDIRSMRSRVAAPPCSGPPLNTTRGLLPNSGRSARNTHGSSGSSGYKRRPRRIAGTGVSGFSIRWPSCTVTSTPAPRSALTNRLVTGPGSGLYQPQTWLQLSGRTGMSARITSSGRPSRRRRSAAASGSDTPRPSRPPVLLNTTTPIPSSGAKTIAERKPDRMPALPTVACPLSSPGSNPRPIPGTRGSGWNCGWNMDTSVSGLSTEPRSPVPPCSRAAR
jgi:hypothetical protein